MICFDIRDAFFQDMSSANVVAFLRSLDIVAAYLKFVIIGSTRATDRKVKRARSNSKPTLPLLPLLLLLSSMMPSSSFTWQQRQQLMFGFGLPG